MPLVNGKYKNPQWVNGGPPAIDAQELNAISDTLENLDAGGGYTLPVASPTVLGGVSPVAKTDSMTESVGVDNQGRLWGMPGGSSGGKRYASFVIGTSTAGWTEADCDYLCDGVDDNIEIQAAIGALRLISGSITRNSGEILILPGTYNISKTIQSTGIVSQPTCHIRGLSSWSQGVVFNWTGSYTTSTNISNQNNVVSLLKIEAGKVSNIAFQMNIANTECNVGLLLSVRGMADSCSFYDCPTGIYTYGSAATIVTNNYVNMIGTTSVGESKYGVYASGGVIVSNNYINPGTTGIGIMAHAGGVYNQILINGNIYGAAETNSASDQGIVIDGYARNVFVTSNHLGPAKIVDNSTANYRPKISNNFAANSTS